MTAGITQGDLIISPPHMPDSRFNRTVIMITQDSPNGSHGFCLNRCTDHTLTDILEGHNIDFPLNLPLYWGGPLNPNTVWMLHDHSWRIHSTIDINDHWSMTSDMRMFHQMSHHDMPKQFRIFFGFAGWGPGQLEFEIKGVDPWDQKHSWLIANDPDPNFLIECPVEDLWEACTTLSGSQAVSHWMT